MRDLANVTALVHIQAIPKEGDGNGNGNRPGLSSQQKPSQKPEIVKYRQC